MKPAQHKVIALCWVFCFNGVNIPSLDGVNMWHKEIFDIDKKDSSGNLRCECDLLNEPSDLFHGIPSSINSIFYSVKKFFYLYNLYVPTDYRNKGEGTQLINKMCDLIKNDGGEDIFLFAQPFGENKQSKEQLLKFYNKLGFKEVYKIYLYDNEIPLLHKRIK